MAKVSIFIDGDPFSPSGIGSGTTAATATVSQTFVLSSGYSVKQFWFSGNGASSILVSSARLIQGSKNIPLKVNGATSFYISATGRWSDFVSIADFTLGQNVTVTITFQGTVNVATFRDNPVPTSPVIVSVIADPLTGTGLTGDILFDVEFEGTFVDSINGFTPSTTQNCSLTATPANVIFGDGSVLFNASAENIPASASYLIYPTNSAFINKCAEDGFTYSMFCKLLAPLYGYPAGSTIHLANVLVKVSGGYDMYAYINGVIPGEPPSTFMDDAAVGGILLNLTLATAVPFIVDGFQIIKGAAWTEEFTPPSQPFTSPADNDPIEITFNSTITLTSNPDAGDTLVLKGGTGGDITFTFVDHYPNNQYEIQIGANVNETAASIAIAINNIAGAEFTATAVDNVITITAYTSTFSMEETGGGVTLGGVTHTLDGLITEDISAADSFTATDGGKAIQENVSVSDAVDGLIDGLSESINVTDFFDVPMDKLDESVSVSTNFDGLIDSMGESND